MNFQNRIEENFQPTEQRPLLIYKISLIFMERKKLSYLLIYFFDKEIKSLNSIEIKVR
jgi:hypothetical protein